ncbi:winged helix-turn-helix domain-containing protein [uncultured Paraglaciecola sp.]|uniref:winged helix-turn-helix domain-containing protein n=1 Tax=uncultured Paraglaciecola sp. TaxID=1765024 RepID=UPI002637083E|nr:winged helix-turn-helix domain-containing protein [uncultured Paraglaciecola sp.]
MTFKNNKPSNKTLSVAGLMQAPFATGSLIVNFSQNQVTRNGEDLVLQPKVLELLIFLCAANGSTVSKQQLTTSLWPDTVVGPDSLANTMTRLRKIINDDAKNPQFIKTVQRKGYLWLPAVVPLVNNRKVLNFKYLAGALFLCGGAILLYSLNRPEPKEFLFPDLSIQKLEGGGYEIEVGIDGELTEEKKAAMLKELKRITGEEHSGMEFTVDPIAPECDKKMPKGSPETPCEQKSNGVDPTY